MTTFGERVERTMQRYGIRPGELSRRTGIKIATLYNIRRGAHVPRIENARKIADALDVPVEWLYWDVSDGSN